MKCFLGDTEIFDLNDTQMNLLRHMIPAHQVEDHIKGLIHYILGQKLRECAGKLFEEWKPRLAKEGVTQVPLMDIDLASLIFDRPDYVTQAVDNGNAETSAPNTLPVN